MDDRLSDSDAAVDTAGDYDALGIVDHGGASKDPMVRGRRRHYLRRLLLTRAHGLVGAFVWRLLDSWCCWKIAVHDVDVDFVPVAPLVLAIDNSPIPTNRLGHPKYPVDPAIDLLSVEIAHIATAGWSEAPPPCFDTRAPIWVTNLGDWEAKRPLLARDKFPKTALADKWEEEILPSLSSFRRRLKIHLLGQRGSISKCHWAASSDVGAKNATGPNRPWITFVAKTCQLHFPPISRFQQWLVLSWHYWRGHEPCREHSQCHDTFRRCKYKGEPTVVDWRRVVPTRDTLDSACLVEGTNRRDARHICCDCEVWPGTDTVPHYMLWYS